jgi:hypothetical protein
MRVCLLLQDHILNKNGFWIATCFFSIIRVLLGQLAFLAGSCRMLVPTSQAIAGVLERVFDRSGLPETAGWRWDEIPNWEVGEIVGLSYYPNWSSDVAMEKKYL